MVKKKGWIKVLAIVIIAGFIINMYFVWARPDPTTYQASNNAAGEILVGYSEFNATMISYQPYLIIVNSITEANKSYIKSNPKVEGIIENEKGTVVSVKKKDDVLDVYDMLKKSNISAFADASIELPYIIEITLDNGTLVNITTGGAVINYHVEPFIQPQSKIKMSIIAIAKEKILVNYNSPALLLEKITVTVNGTITSLYSKNIIYSIPWKMRNDPAINDLKRTLGNLSVYYSRNNNILFGKELTPSQIQEKKNLPYIIYISEKSAVVQETFSDVDKINSDFNNTITFPASILEVYTNETLSLNYDKKELYLYTVNVTFPDNEYDISHHEFNIKTLNSYNIADKISLNINISVIGKHILNISSVEVS